jgi:hypothetical protein
MVIKAKRNVKTSIQRMVPILLIPTTSINKAPMAGDTIRMRPFMNC